MDIYNLIRICFSHVVTHVAVPTFFLISGFLFFLKVQKWNREIYFRKIKSRFHTLFIPYILWNAIAILLIVGLKVGAFIVKGKPLSNILAFFQENGWWQMFWDSNVWAKDRLNWLGWATPMTGPINLPLWFLRDLIVVALVTPIIYWLLKRFRFYVLYLLALAYISGIWPSIPGFTVTSVFFFSVGAYWSIYAKNLVFECKRVEVLSYVVAAVLLIITIRFDGRNTHAGSLVYPFFVIFGVCATINVAARLVETKKVKVNPLLAKSSFFIYATHTLMILGICRALVHKIIYWDTPLALGCCYFIVPLLAVIICLCLYVFMRRFFPGILNVLTGSR